MSRLINPGVGDIVDRLSILELKVLHGELTQKDTAHWVRERDALLVQLGGRTLNGAWFQLALELAVVNAALWRAEDELRAHRHAHTELVADPKELQQLVRAVGTAFLIQQLNDQRAGLIGEINTKAGDDRGKEKG